MALKSILVQNHFTDQKVTQIDFWKSTRPKYKIHLANLWISSYAVESTSSLLACEIDQTSSKGTSLAKVAWLGSEIDMERFLKFFESGQYHLFIIRILVYWGFIYLKSISDETWFWLWRYCFVWPTCSMAYPKVLEVKIIIIRNLK